MRPLVGLRGKDQKGRESLEATVQSLGEGCSAPHDCTPDPASGDGA